ncbi:unnamed protein product [Prunus brigantina]
MVMVMVVVGGGNGGGRGDGRGGGGGGQPYFPHGFAGLDVEYFRSHRRRGDMHDIRANPVGCIMWARGTSATLDEMR